MAGPTKRESGVTPTPDRDPNEQPLDHAEQVSPEYVVARGRSVRVAGKLLGPGQPVDLPKGTLTRLQQAGFIVPVAVEPAAEGGVRVGGLQIRGGRRPGAQIA